MEQLQLFPSAPILIESTRSIGYSFESAIADIIDNSISAEARNVYIEFEANNNPFVAIIDDGKGMTRQELIAAMKYGSQSSLSERSKSDLGRFGLGLKVASLSQCRRLSVITKTEESTLIGASWDLDVIEQTQDWMLLILSEQEVKNKLSILKLKALNQGTIVIWEEFDRISNSSIDTTKIIIEKMDNVSKHLSLVFHKYMSQYYSRTVLNIEVNGVKLKATDPFLIHHPSTQPIPIETLTIDKQNIYVQPHILPHAKKLTNANKVTLGKVDDYRTNQGFYVYRNKRLIIWGTWFKLFKQNELTNLARVSVEIPNSLDHIWEIDVKKSTATLPDIIRKKLQAVTEASIEGSEKVYRYRGIKEKNKSIQNVWDVVTNNGKFMYRINRETEMFKVIESMIPDKNSTLFHNFMTLLEEQFPYADVYYRYSKNMGDLEEPKQDQEGVYLMAKSIIETLKESNTSILAFMKGIQSTAPFKDFPEVIKRIHLEESYEE